MERKVNSILSETEETIVNSLANALFGASRTIPENVNWQAVYTESVSQAVMPLVFTDNKLVPSDIQMKYERDRHIALAYNIIREQEHVQLDCMMESEKISYVILKGCASARYYPNPVLRSMGDVDFWVYQEDFDRAGQFLTDNGYTSWNKNHICHEVYRKGESHLEMHFEPAGIPHGKVGDLVREYLQDTIDKATAHQIVEGGYMVPSDFHHGLIILLHTSHHMTGEGVGLRHLCDWAVFVASMSNERFCELFEGKLKNIGMWHFAQVITKVAIQYLGCPNREWVGSPDEGLVDAIMRDIFKGGNFGHKDYRRGQETLLISSRGKEGVGNKSMLRQLVTSMNEIVYMKWPVSKKCFFLRPAGWCFYGGRYVVRSLLGKRPKINVNAVMKGADERRNLYAQLKIFDNKGE